MKAIFERELNSYFNGIQGYLCAAFILLFAGLYCMSVNLTQGYVNFEYVLSNMVFILLIVITNLTMRVISEERRQKTDQLLYSLPLGSAKIIIGKYLAVLVVLALPCAILCVYPYILSMYGDVPLRVAYISIFAFFMLAASLASIGVFISSTTENQGIAAGICFVCMLLLYFGASLASFVPATAIASLITLAAIIALFGLILYLLVKSVVIAAAASLLAEGALALVYFLAPTAFEGLIPTIVENISVFDRFYNFTYGIFDLNAVVYFISVIVVFLFLSMQSLEKRRWS